MAQSTSMSNYWLRRPGRIFVSVDSAANDSDKTMTVPTGYIWKIENLFVTLATTADVGNRQMTVIVTDGTNTLGNYNALAVQAASTTEYYNFAPYYGTATETPAGRFCTPMPVHTLPAGSTIRVYDSAAVAASGDDLTVVIYGIAYEDH